MDQTITQTNALLLTANVVSVLMGYFMPLWQRPIHKGFRAMGCVGSLKI